jgi:hypothetical protein
MITVKIEDVRRATLPLSSGNEGWIGVAPDGQEYHVVVPVDAQIAKGVMACNRPMDGTPFGGYTRWLYFRCVPYEDDGRLDRSVYDRQVEKNAADLIAWLRLYGIQVRLTCKDETGRHVSDSQAGQGESGMPVQDFGPCKKPDKQH